MSSRNVFGTILREQLEISRADFWEAIRSGEQVSYPVETEEAPVEFLLEDEQYLIG